RQRVHVIGVTLRGVIRVFVFAPQGVLGDAGSEAAAFAIDDGNPNAQRAEIHAGNHAHRCRPGRNKATYRSPIAMSSAPHQIPTCNSAITTGAGDESSLTPAIRIRTP